jgi:hypothetical protein
VKLFGIGGITLIHTKTKYVLSRRYSLHEINNIVSEAENIKEISAKNSKTTSEMPPSLNVTKDNPAVKQRGTLLRTSWQLSKRKALFCNIPDTVYHFMLAAYKPKDPQ